MSVYDYDAIFEEQGDSTSSKYRQSSEILLVLRLFDAIADQRPCLSNDKQDEEQESKLVHHMLVHVTVVQSFHNDAANQDQRNIAGILL